MCVDVCGWQTHTHRHVSTHSLSPTHTQYMRMRVRSRASVWTFARRHAMVKVHSDIYLIYLVAEAVYYQCVPPVPLWAPRGRYSGKGLHQT